MTDLNTIYNVNAIAQAKSMSCWAAAAAMLISWKTNLPTDEMTAVQSAGDYYVQAFISNTGLYGFEIANFAAALHLLVEPPQNLTPGGYADLLTRVGPLWVGTAVFSHDIQYRHVRILRGVLGDGTSDGTTAFIIDPDGARDYTETITQFAMELEQIAKDDLGAGAELDPQIIHYPPPA